MGQALYRKYRSKSLTEMVGQEHITEALGNAIKSGRISHAYLFTGPRGTGKTSAARILAHQITNVPYDGTQHLDIIEIDAASNRRIDDIRDLRDRVHIAPTSGKHKVYIIDEVHMLTGESFNALLKTLEEPPEHAVFILATTEAHKLPATIISRTQRYNFRLAPLPKVIEHLKMIASKERITIDDSALEIIAEHGGGSFRDSISLLDQLANISSGAITGEGVERSLGLASGQTISSLIEAIKSGDHQSLNAQLTVLEAQGTTTASLLPQLIRSMQHAASSSPQFYALIDRLIDVPKAYNPKLKLRTTILLFALSQHPENTAPPKPQSSKATPVTAPGPVLTVEAPRPAAQSKPTTKPKPGPTEPQQATGKRLDDITPDIWAQTLTNIKEGSAPLFGVLRQAQPVFDANSQTLTLRFRYQLHQRKIDAAEPKKLLADTLLGILGGSPIIATEITSDSTPPTFTEPPKAPPASDQTAEAVIAVMGGGEVVDAQ